MKLIYYNMTYTYMYIRCRTMQSILYICNANLIHIQFIIYMCI